MASERDINKISETVKTKFPNVTVEQLKVTHPADDNGVWYFGFENNKDEIQIESSDGNCPFLIESDRNNDRRYGNSINEVANIICEHLETSRYKK